MNTAPSQSSDFDASRASQQHDSLLRILACGSVGDGKSTLIDTLLNHSNSEQDRWSTADIAYCGFVTPERNFVVADAPGLEQYTQSIASGASNSELAVILVDARNGVLTQTHRHAYITSLLGIRNIVLAVNKIDLIEFSQDAYNGVCEEFLDFAANLNFERVFTIPISARFGDNVTAKSERTPWYDGPPLLTHLESVELKKQPSTGPCRMPIQEVHASDQDFRGLSGKIVSGGVALGDAVVLAKSGRASRVKKIIVASAEVESAGTGQVATISLEDEINVSRGDVLVDPQHRPEIADQFAAHLLWMAEDELLPHRQYLIKIGAQTVPAQVTQLKHKVDVNSLEHLAARTLRLNEIAYCNFSTTEPIAFDSFSKNREMGAFVLIDRETNETVGAGMIEFGLRRATNVHWQALDVNSVARAELKHQKPCVLWFTGLSGSGKSTIANLVEKRLFAQGRHTYILDGDNVRHGLNQDLGFTDADRVENIRRVAEAANLFVDAGLIVLASFISPFRSERQLAREVAKEGEFVEIFVDAPIEVCMTRDPKGLYKRAKAGEIKNFTGIDSPYEPPENPDLVLKTEGISADEAAERVVNYLKEKGWVP